MLDGKQVVGCLLLQKRSRPRPTRLGDFTQSGECRGAKSLEAWAARSISVDSTRLALGRYRLHRTRENRSDGCPTHGLLTYSNCSGDKANREMKFLAPLISLPAFLLIGFVRAYQLLISPWFGATCRFQPTCSAYFIESVKRQGVFLGSWRGVCRIAKCHPFHRGGYDPPE